MKMFLFFVIALTGYLAYRLFLAGTIIHPVFYFFGIIASAVVLLAIFALVLSFPKKVEAK
jgi:hypothetical protein